MKEMCFSSVPLLATGDCGAGILETKDSNAAMLLLATLCSAPAEVVGPATIEQRYATAHCETRERDMHNWGNGPGDDQGCRDSDFVQERPVGDCCRRCSFPKGKREPGVRPETVQATAFKQEMRVQLVESL